MEEKQFRETLQQLTAQAKKQQMCISQEQLAEYFPDLIKNEEQNKLLLEYLHSQKITVGEQADMDEFLSMEDKNYLEDYLQSIGEIRQLEQEQLVEVMYSAVAGDKEAQQVVLTQFLIEVADLAKLYTGQGVLLEDLIGEGNLALTMAVGDLACLEATENIWEEVHGFLGKCMMDAMEQMIQEEENSKNIQMEQENDNRE